MSQQGEMIPMDCRRCGACCESTAYGLGPYVPVEDDEVPRFVVLLGATPIVKEPDCFLLPVKDHPGDCPRCPFLVGDVGEAVSCSIYADRPRACVSVPAGGDECLKVRSTVFDHAYLPELAAELAAS